MKAGQRSQLLKRTVKQVTFLRTHGPSFVPVSAQDSWRFLELVRGGRVYSGVAFYSGDFPISQPQRSHIEV